MDKTFDTVLTVFDSSEKKLETEMGILKDTSETHKNSN